MPNMNFLFLQVGSHLLLFLQERPFLRRLFYINHSGVWWETAVRLPWGFLFFSLNKSCFLSLCMPYASVPQPASQPSARLSPFCQNLFCATDSKLVEPSVTSAALPVLRRGDNNFPQYSGFTLAAQYTDWYAVSSYHCWLIFNTLSPGNPRSFSPELLSYLGSP